MTRSTHIWVLIPAHRAAFGHLQVNLALLGSLSDHVVVVTNGQHPLTEHEVPHHLIQAGMGINISHWWNLGLDFIEEKEAGERHHVLVLNADALIRPEGVARLSYALDTNPGYAIAHPKAGIGVDRVHRPGPYGVQTRMTGWVFMLTSDVPMRADERFRWWCGDDDLEWRAAQEGGVLRVGRIEAAHLGDGEPRGELRTLARDDLVRFEEKWGIRPF